MRNHKFIFAMFAILFSVCGSIGFFNVNNSSRTYATSTLASVWDGTNPSSVDDSDYYSDDGKNYYIRSAKGFAYFASLVNGTSESLGSGSYQTFKGKNVYLSTDIDLNGYAWKPIGLYSQTFEGTFNGNGYRIYNLSINNADSSDTKSYDSSLDPRFVGLFGYLRDSAVVKNLHISNINIDVVDKDDLEKTNSASQNAEIFIGGLVGGFSSSTTASSSNLQNCSVSGQINIKIQSADEYNVYVGGLVGFVNGTKIEYCETRTEISTKIYNSEMKLGGLVGCAYDVEISGCATHGDISYFTKSSSMDVGGIVGYTLRVDSYKSVRISNSFNRGNLNNLANDGAGVNLSSGTVIKTGGLVGNAANQSGYSSYLTLQNVYNAGNISFDQKGSGAYFGGLVGSINSANLSTNFNDSFSLAKIGQNVLDLDNVSYIDENIVDNTNVSYLFNYSIGKPTANQIYYNVNENLTGKSQAVVNLAEKTKTQEFYSNKRFWGENSTWDFGSVWKISYSENGSLPYLIQLSKNANSNNDADYSGKGQPAGEGTKDSPYLIRTAGDLGWVSFNYSYKSGAYYALQNNIDLSGKTWQPIGSKTKPFSGVFDGNGYRLTGISCSLQEQFSYHGLFGVTENAVIKNLILDKISFINDGKESNNGTAGYMGSIIAYASGNTYLINCVDNSRLYDSSLSINTVGMVASSGKLFTLYGVFGSNLAGDMATGVWNFDGTVFEGAGRETQFIEGYDVIINGKGGNFYDSSIKIYTGIYHILLIKDGAKFKVSQTESTVKDKNGANIIIDDAFGKTYLPKLSTEYGKQDVLIMRGYKLQGYKYVKTNEWVGGSQENSQNLISKTEISQTVSSVDFDINKGPLKGIYAVWSDSKIIEQVKIIYNAYEKSIADFNIVAKGYSSGSLWQLDKDGYVYVTYGMEYDSFLADYSNIFYAPSYYSSTSLVTLRDGAFAVEGIYDTFDVVNTQFENKTVSNMLVNDNLKKILYAKWRGLEESKYQIKINFISNESFAGNFDMNNAVKSISITKQYEAGECAPEELTDTTNYQMFSKLNSLQDGGNGTFFVTFDYDTRLSDKIDDWFKLEIELNAGYEFFGSASFKADNILANGKYVADSNFGTMDLFADKTTSFNNLQYKNSVGDFSVTITLGRIESSNDITIGEGVVFGVSPMIDDYETVEVLKNDGNLYTLGTIMGTAYNNFSSYIGYDFANNKLLSASNVDDAYQLPNDYLLDNITLEDSEIDSKENPKNYKYIVFKYNFAGGVSQYFVYCTYDAKLDGNDVNRMKLFGGTMGENNIFVCDNILLTLDKKSAMEFTMSYLADSTFAFLFSTEFDTSKMAFSKFAIAVDSVDQRKTTVQGYKQSNDSLTKGGMLFNHIIKLIEDGKIFATTIYTQVVVDFRLVTIKQDGELEKINANAPKIYSSKSIYDNSESGIIEFYVESSNYYKFFADRKNSGSNAITLYDTTAGKDTSSSFNIKVEVQDVNLTSGDTEKWQGNFNAANMQYLTSTLISYAKGEEDNSIQFSNDAYKISLSFLPVTDTDGLQAGLYTINIVCTDVLYSANFATKFVDVSDLNNGNNTNFAEESDSKIDLSFTVNSGTYNGITESSFYYKNLKKNLKVCIGGKSIKYGDAIVATSTMGLNKAYVFYGWYIIKEGEKGSYVNDINTSSVGTETATFEFGKQFQSSGYSSSDTTLTIFAVYIRKELTVIMSNKVLVMDEDGSGQNRQMNTSILGLSIALNKTEKNVDNLFYQYKSEEETDTSSLSKLSFTKSGTNETAYYIVGFRILLQEENIDSIILENVEANAGNFEISGKNQFDLYVGLKNQIETGNTSQSQTYYILPLIKQKTANLHFYSGTGTDNEYGDNRNGQVFDTSIQETTNSIFEINNVYFGRTFYLNFELDGQLDGQTTEDVVPSELFATRTGYDLPLNNYWKTNKENLNGDILQLTSLYFDNTSTETQIYVYRNWVAHKYEISFMPNGGTYSLGQDRIFVRVVYDNVSDFSIPTDEILKRMGYKISGWALDENGEQKVLEANGSIVYVDGINPLFRENGEYYATSDQTLYAIWKEQSYILRIKFNGANTINGEDVAFDEQLEYYRDYEIDYDSTLANLSVGGVTLKLSDIVPTREGYIFDGFYCFSNSYKRLVTDESVFNDYLGCDVSAIPNLILYAGWRFDNDYLSLTIQNNVIDNLIYNANQQDVSLASYFTLDNFSYSGCVISIEENDLVLSASNNSHSIISTQLTSDNATVENDSDVVFAVRDAGVYSVNFCITFTDNASYMNLGDVWIANYEFVAIVDKANITGSFNEEYYMQNAINIIKPFVVDSIKSQLSVCESFDRLIQIMKSVDMSISGLAVSHIDLYKYFMVKYYNLVISNDATNHKLYRSWTYSDYETFVNENGEYAEQIVTMLTYFDFYDYTYQGFSKEIDRYKNIVLSSSTVVSATLNEEICIDKVCLYSNEQLNLVPNTFYEMRFYIKNNKAGDNLKNYQISYDETDTYLSFGSGYLLPQILEIENQSNSKVVYYNDVYQYRSLSWYGEREMLQDASRDYYLVGENLYLSTGLNTSNNGDAEVDTVFNFFDNENYLYFENAKLIRIVEADDDVYYDNVTSNFKLTMDENDIFTILNIKDVARVLVSASYLTRDNGNFSFDTIANSMASGLLRITTISYNLDGDIKTVYEPNGIDVGSLVDNGIMIYEIVKNQANEIEIMMANPVIDVTVSTTTNAVSQFIKLYKWMEQPSYLIDGTMTGNGSLTIKKEDITMSESGLTEIHQYAVYTDLVLVNYDLSFPENYEISSSKTSVVKLGKSTANDLNKPEEKGFVLSSLKAKTATGDLIDYTEIFTGSDMGNGAVYVGYNSQDVHAPINLVAKWQMEDINYRQIKDYYKTAVLSFDKLYANEVVQILNQSNFLTYSYEWYRDSQLFASGDYMTLKGKGSANESGSYQLKLVATLSKDFVMCLEDSSANTLSYNFDFELDFVKHKIVATTLPTEEERQIVFNNTERINSWKVGVDYVVYSRPLEDYSTDPTSLQFFYTNSGSIYFKVVCGGNEVTSMKNAGTYSVTLLFDDEIFVLDESLTTSDTTFEIVILPYEVALEDFEIMLTKNFDADDPALSKSVYVTNETVTISLTRQSGEDIGEYELYFADIDKEIKTNYTFKFNEQTIFENGELTTLGEIQSIGTFTITSTGMLRLSYEETESNPAVIKVDYSEDGYSIDLTNDFKLQIKNGSEVYKEIALKLYDVAEDKEITDSAVLEILGAKMSDITSYLFAAQKVDSAYNCGVYTYYFENGTEIGKYFYATTFANGFEFDINERKVDVSSFNMNKTFDGQSTSYWDLEGSLVNDIDAYDGIYVKGEYASVHAGTNIIVSLVLGSTLPEDSQKLQNYVLSQSQKTATISKLSAEMTVEMTKTSFTYGEISINNLTNYVESFTLSAQGEDKTSLLETGYYTVLYSLPNTTATNDKGFLFKGSYTLQATTTFVDFVITSKHMPTFVVNAMTYEKNIPQSYIVVTALDTIQETYDETLNIDATGDTITLQFVANGLTAGQKASVGLYDLSLRTTTFVNDSIVVSINSNNQGFDVLYETDTLYIGLDNDDFLTQTYNGENFTISADITAKTFSLTNLATTSTSSLSFFTKSDGGNVAVDSSTLTFTKLNFTANSKQSLKDAGKYKIVVDAICGEYNHIALDTDYYLEINAISIDISQFTITKAYDGNAILNLTSINEKVEDDDVFVVAKFDSVNVGTNISVSLYLDGTSKTNYSLSSNSTTGNITKAQAIVEFLQTKFVFGKISGTAQLSYKVTAGTTTLFGSQYSLTVVIEDEVKSDGEYLAVGSYKLAITDVDCADYDITLPDTTITVTPYDLSVSLTNSAVVRAEYGSELAETTTFTYNYLTPLYEYVTLTLIREEGTNVGDYKVSSGTISDGNYNLVSLEDVSATGFFRIVPASQTLYLLASDKASISSTDEECINTTFVYDGQEYLNVYTEEIESGTYRLVFESTSGTKQMFDLSPYTYDRDSEIYTKSTTLIENLKSTLYINVEKMQNVGAYYIYLSTSSSTNYSVRLGKEGYIYAFKLNITKKDLFFKDRVYSKTFDNKNAEFVYDDASEVLSGVVANENIKLEMKFVDGDGAIAKYVGVAYDIETTISGETISNYNFHETTADGESLSGKISRAEMKIIINTQTFEYADTIQLEYDYSTDVDLTDYDTNRIDYRIDVQATEANYSTSENLNVGEYSLVLTITRLDDFNIAKYICDNKERDDLSAKLNITQKSLELAVKSESFPEIFTKKYDGSKSVAIKDSDEQLRFNLAGIVTDDVVTVASASYASEYIGQSIQIDFVLSGADSANYKLSPYLFGVITSVNVSISFNYNSDGSEVTSNVDDKNLATLSTLSFPFMSNSYLTSNSADSNTNSVNNFPTSLSGKTGYAFLYWTMDFVGVANGSAELTYLENLTTSLRMITKYDGSVYSIRVDNGERTVKLLKNLIEDENDYFGLYYKTNDSLAVTFNANWDTNKYRITIVIANENGKQESLGTVEVYENDAETVSATVTTNYLAEFSYDSSLKLKASANPHCFFEGFYLSNGTALDGTEDYLSISKEGQIDVLTISNIRQNYNFVVRFTKQKVDVVLDLSSYNDASISSTDFVSQGNGKYVWAITYQTAADFTLSQLPTISRTGYEVIEFVTAKTTISKENFETTKLTDLLADTSNKTLTLTLTPTFEAVGIVVTLNYGYDGKTKEISVPFASAYNSSADWEETPSREGYDFVAWQNASGETVTGLDILNTTEPHTLTATWQICAYDLALVSPNAEISNDSIGFVLEGTTYTKEQVEYGTVITFKVTANQGYEISSAWASEFEVVINADGTANIALTMPAKDFEYTLPILPLDNTITMNFDDKVGEIHVFDVTIEDIEEELTLTDKKFSIASGKKVKIVASATSGYEMANDVRFEDETDINVTKEVINGTLTIVISGINKDNTIYVSALESKNDIEILFDDASLVESVDVDGTTYKNIANLPHFQVTTGENFTFYVKYVHGYKLASTFSEQYVVENQYLEDGAYRGYFEITVSLISQNGSLTINSTIAKFTLSVAMISYDENRNQADVAENIALVNNLERVEVNYGTSVILTYSTADLYNFAGWSKDGVDAFSNLQSLEYTVVDDETIYAIFSKLKYSITLGTYEYFTIYNEYNDESKIETKYNEIPNGRYFDNDSKKEISGMELYYGASKNIVFNVPNGYMYYGFGYMGADGFVFLEIDEQTGTAVTVNISTLMFDINENNIKIYMVVKAYSISMNFKTQIDIDGVREEDVDVGWICMVDKEGNNVNRYGYIDGTRVHYASGFANGNLTNNKEFDVVAYTGETFYLKVKVLKEGYKFSMISANTNQVNVLKLKETDEFFIYEISGFVGGTDGISFEVLFKPQLNIINLSFENNNIKVDGGVFGFEVAPKHQRKVWTAGREYSSIMVSAYTDSEFEVFAYIRSGYKIDFENIQIKDESGIIVDGSMTYQILSVQEAGYTGLVRFKVAGYLGANDICIVVTPLQYSVVLKEDGVTLARIENVTFDSMLNLTERNSNNIQIYDDRIAYLAGKLIFNFKKERHYFEGFFTSENGGGIQYISSSGEAVNAWKESGYVYDAKTGTYKLGSNAKIVDELTGEIEITLYLYWSYLKTRINFEFVPTISTTISAQDMVSGVDYTNSWFYESAPMYIEVSFNTDIHIYAPEIAGYKFYKFVISQKNANGVWLTDVVAYSNYVPWSTNEFDRIVECKIQVVYFAQIEVTIFGGDGQYKITQDILDAQGKVLLQQGYVDTTKPFTIEAQEAEGYQFIKWTNASSGSSIYTKTMSLSTTRKLGLVMTLSGLSVQLNFEDYDTKFGQIVSLRAVSRANGITTLRLGGYSGDEFIKTVYETGENVIKVGDKVTFVVSVDFGFSTKWNRNDIIYDSYSGGFYYFTMEIPAESAGQTLSIIPTFEDEILSIYIKMDFVESDKVENSVDLNTVSLAGFVTFNGKRTNFVTSAYDSEIRIATVTSNRYEIASITINNYDNSFTDMSKFFTEDKEIVLTPKFVEDENIIGNVQILIEYKRSMWEDENIESASFDGKGSKGNPYKIKDIEDLILMMKLVNDGTFNEEGISYRDLAYELENDIDLGEKFWTPIGTSSSPFNGYFNFNGYEITSIYNAYIYSTVGYNGLFGVLGSNAEIVSSKTTLWYVYMIIGIVAFLVILLVLLLVLNKKRKKRREEMSTK